MMLRKISSKAIIQIAIVYLYVLQINGDGISCFKCYASQPGYEETNQLCSQFDGSQRFQVYCPASTLCMKKTVYYRTKTSVTTAVLRDCAPQKRTGQTYNENDNKWYKEEEVVKTAYEERCFTGEVRGLDPPEYCFCSYHLCNSSQPTRIVKKSNLYLLILTLLIISHYKTYCS